MSPEPCTLHPVPGTLVRSRSGGSAASFDPAPSPSSVSVYFGSLVSSRFDFCWGRLQCQMGVSPGRAGARRSAARIHIYIYIYRRVRQVGIGEGTRPSSTAPKEEIVRQPWGCAHTFEMHFSILEQLLYRNVQWFRGGLVFKAHRRLYD